MITVIILTNRADDRLRKCLISVKWATEILLIDDATGTDWSSWEAEFGCQVIKHDQPLNNFAEARNQAIQKATQPWVFFIDSDEVLTPASVPEVKQVVHSSVDGAEVRRSDIFYGKKLKWGEVGQVRLIRLGKKTTLHFERPVHEVGVIDGTVATSKIELEHTSHLSISDFLRSITQHSCREAEYRCTQKRPFSIFELLVYPPAKGFYNLVLRLGLLDGWRGLIYVVMMSLHSLMVRVFLYEKYVAKTAK